MNAEKRLNERAGSESRWHLPREYTLHVGPAYRLPDHNGAVPVLLVGLYGAFNLQVENKGWQVCRAAVIPPGLTHSLDFRGDPIAALFVEPNFGTVSTLAEMVDNASGASGAVIGRCREVHHWRSLYESDGGPEDTADVVSELVGFGRRNAINPAIDPRIARAVQSLSQPSEEPVPVARLADDAGLSSSRFQHLFSDQVGVPYRRYRSWTRMRVAIGEISAGRSCTEAAHAAGYADLAHFTRDCKRTFGGVFRRRHR